MGDGLSNERSAANQNTREEMTLEALQSEPWSAVYQPLPADADRTLLAAVALIADECAKSAFAAARVSEIVQPELADYYEDRQTEAIERRTEARQKLKALAPEDGAQVTPFLERDELRNKAVIGLLNMGNRRQRVEGCFWPDHVTDEALDKNPWAAAFSALPDDVSPEFAERVAKTAWGLTRDAEAHRDASFTREEAAVWDAHIDAAWQACLAAEKVLNEPSLDEPDRFEKTVDQPEFTGADPALIEILGEEALRSISDPIDPAADIGTLRTWREWVGQTIDELNELSESIEPWSIPPSSIDDLLHKATARIEELDARLEEARAAEDATPPLEIDAHDAEAVQHRENFRLVKGGTMEQPGFAEASFDATQSDQEVREAWRAKAFSPQTIEADPWTAVYSAIPQDADRWLLMKAFDAAAQCQDMVMQGSVPRLQQGNDGPAENIQRAAARQQELGLRLETALGRAPEPNVEAITPSNPSERDKSADAIKPGRNEPDRNMPESDVRQAWQQPELSLDTIRHDRWTAVYLPIPEKSDAMLLAEACRASAACIAWITMDREHGPKLPQGNDGPAENLQHAAERIDELTRRLERAGQAHRPDVQDQLRAADGYLRQAHDLVAGPDGARSEGNDELRVERDILQARVVVADLLTRPLDRSAAQEPSRDIRRDAEKARTANPESVMAAAEQERSDGREAFTLEDVKDRSWAVIEKAIPQVADAELLRQAREVAASWVEETERDMTNPLGAAFEEEYIARFEAATGRLAEIDAYLRKERRRDEAAEQMLDDWRTNFERGPFPEVSPGWIAEDPWRAVTAPLSRDASADFLTLVANTAGELKGEAERRSVFAPNEEDATDWRHIAEEASRRQDEALERAEAVRSAQHEPGRDEAALAELLGENAHRAIHEPIPKGADDETLKHLRENVEHTIDRLDELSRSTHATTISPKVIDEELERANGRLLVLHMQLEALHSPDMLRWPDPGRAYGEFLSSTLAMSRAGEHSARAMDIVLGSLIGYAVDEPELTPEQVRLQMLADAERAEAQGFAAAKQQDAAELDAINTEINHHKSPVHGGAGDQPTRPDTLYELYPGLTHGDGGYDQERKQEADRAFYDTGIERGR
jgi:hypothetical protein